MDINYYIDPAILFAITMGASLVLFTTIRLLLKILYSTALVRWSFFQQYLEKTRNRGLPLVAKYGSIGLVAFVAVPLPATGVCAATVLSWLLDMKWQVSLMAIIPGAVISNGIVTLSALGILRGMNLVTG